ncbi:MAG: FAD-dependent monooxygenase, partial [Polyangiaceae bacterium]
MRILIVGAGVAGMTLAALLHQRGERPTVVERAPGFDHAGYMISLYTLGSRVLHGLGLFERFRGESVAMERYEALDARGRALQAYDMAPVNARFGPVLGTSRPRLVGLLRAALADADIRTSDALESIEPRGAEVVVTLGDGSTAAWDLVVGADGLRSRTRTLLFGEQPGFDTGWGGGVGWADASAQAREAVVERWGAGGFLGGYPTSTAVGVFAAARARDGFDADGDGRRARLLDRFAGWGGGADALLASLPSDDAPMFFWRLSDVRSREWSRGRVVL